MNIYQDGMEKRGHLIGFVGHIASGKSIVANYVNETYLSHHVRFSDVLRTIANNLCQNTDQTTLQKTWQTLRDVSGQENILAQMVYSKLSKDIENKNIGVIVVEGIRMIHDIDALSTFVETHPFNLTLVYIDAPFKDRLMWYNKRCEKDGIETILELDFCRIDRHECESQIEKVRKACMIEIHNDRFNSVQDLLAKVDDAIRTRIS